tara:strand:- start:217 stop:612 length:396 start_codon:yes stop_codon:yes gene_type:complete
MQLIFGLILLVGLYFSSDSGGLRIGFLIIFLIVSIAYNTKLLTNIQLEDGHYIFETYSIINQKEEIKISEIELTQLKYKIGSIFTSHNLTLKCKGNKGIRSIKLYINAGQSSELLSMLVQIKKTIADKKQQ